MWCMLDFFHTENFKPCNDESEDSDHDNEFDAFAEGLHRNLYDLIVIEILTVKA